MLNKDDRLLAVIMGVVSAALTVAGFYYLAGLDMSQPIGGEDPILAASGPLLTGAAMMVCAFFLAKDSLCRMKAKWNCEEILILTFPKRSIGR
ncbi:MAG: hypothetical protein WCT40_03690 [Candidatus Magasanikbacteria bacterium]